MAQKYLIVYIFIANILCKKIISLNTDIEPTESNFIDDLEKRTKPFGWSPWTDWSTCSRSCDGGVAYQLRRCHSSNGCRGDPVRYKICNMQPCPESQDFRSHQCAAFNDVPYDGALLKWTPHYDYTEPCALTCRGRPAHLQDDGVESVISDEEPSVIVQLATRVQDATRCRSGSLDMCIQGKCQLVGCDLKIGSTKKIDACGVCGGDGTSCSEPLHQWEIAAMSLCSVTCGGGYKMARPVCRNRLTEVDVDESLCAAASRPEPTIVQCNTHNCPPKWITDDWGTCSKQCNGGTRERSVVCLEESNGVKYHVADDICLGPKPKSYENCNIFECPAWTLGDWSGCSVSCGKGIQVRAVECLVSNEISSLCDSAFRPNTSQPCSTGIKCPDKNNESASSDEIHPIIYADQPYYAHSLVNTFLVPVPREVDGPQTESLINEQKVPGEATYIKDYNWSACSVSCGDGIRRRQYRCKIFLEFSKTVATLNDSLCLVPKPLDEVERCVMEPCSLAYGYDESYPRDTHRQISDGVKVAAAVPGKTYSWREQGYTSCSASCLGGVEELIINCVRDDTSKVVSPFLCTPETKPEARIRTCNDRPCPPRWNYSEYSPCTKSCGIGIKTREVQCIHEVTRGGENTMVVPNNMCPQPPPPDRQYCNVLDCPVKWEVSEWSKCSKQCGSGVKERKVECKQVMAQEHKVERPPAMCPNVRPPDKKPCNAKPCTPEEQNPPILHSNTTYIQHDPKKTKVTLKIGGAATVFYGTQIKIKCPVKRFNRTRIQWSKNYNFLGKTKKYKISKKGALRVMNVTFQDTGIYSCHAGLSKADLSLNVKPKPGDAISNEEYKIYKEESGNMRPDSQMAIHLSATNDKEQQTNGGNTNGRSRDKNKGKQKNKASTTGLYGDSTNIMEDEEPIRSRSQMPASVSNSGSRTASMPYFKHLLASLQTFTKSRGHHLLGDYNHLNELESEEKVLPSFAQLASSTDGAIVLGQGSPENLNFVWVTGSWTNCTNACNGTNENKTLISYKYRTIQCYVHYNNASHKVDRNLCEDAGLPLPTTKEKCILTECPYWTTSKWYQCRQRDCFSWHTAIQIRSASCKYVNGTISNKCNPLAQPYTRRECYNELCKGVWRVEPWSECNASCGQRGVRHRIIQCVWYGTKRPAGNLCHNHPRPNIIKNCRRPACLSNSDNCQDISQYCRKVKNMGFCRLHRYQQQCCRTCKFNKFNK